MRRKLRALVIRLFPDRALFQLRRVLFKLKWREPELALVQVLARPEKAFLDVGAHKGVYCLAALGQHREIIGVEPFPPMARYLQAGLGRKGPDHAHGALEPPGQLPLRVPLRGGTSVPSIASLEPGTGPTHDYKEVMVEVGRARRS